MEKSMFKLASSRKRKVLTSVVIGMVLFLTSSIQAHVTDNSKTVTLPSWCSAAFVDAHYYYIPDVEAYYDVHSSMFIYQEKSVWVHKTSLPEKYRSYDLNCGYKIMIKGNIDFDGHKGKFAKVVGIQNKNANVEKTVEENNSDKLAQLVF